MFQCPPEYKVPGLYVMDAIIRNEQCHTSHHQQQSSTAAAAGHRKDLYAKRFEKNLGKTFSNLFSKCSDYDRVRARRPP